MTDTRGPRVKIISGIRKITDQAELWPVTFQPAKTAGRFFGTSQGRPGADQQRQNADADQCLEQCQNRCTFQIEFDSCQLIDLYFDGGVMDSPA